MAEASLILHSGGGEIRPTSPYPYTSGDPQSPGLPSGHVYTDMGCGRIDITPISRHQYNYADFTCGSVMITPWALTLSGVFANVRMPPPPECVLCGKTFPGLAVWGSGHDLVTVPSAYGPPSNYCYECAGYRRDLGRFENREDWIRESVPLRPDTDPLIVADWLEDHNRPKDAAHLRAKYLKQPDEGV